MNRLRRLWPYLFVIAAAGLCAGIARAQPRYPGWFLATPERPGVLFAVGTAPSYVNDSSGVGEARRRARAELARMVFVDVRGEQYFETLAGGQVMFRGERFDEQGLPDSLLKVSYLDSVRTPTMTLVLAAVGEPGEPIGQEWLAVDARAPAWVAKTPSAPGYLYAVGMSERYYYEPSGWQEAERHARQQLALAAQASIRSLMRGLDGSDNAVTAIETRVRFTGAGVVARWRDPRACYVLMRVPVEQVTPERAE